MIDHILISNLHLKSNKGNAMRGVSPRLKIKPRDLENQYVPDSLKV